jgi:hypothetical protein
MTGGNEPSDPIRASTRGALGTPLRRHPSRRSGVQSAIGPRDAQAHGDGPLQYEALRREGRLPSESRSPRGYGT